MEKLLHERLRDYLSLGQMSFIESVGTKSVKPEIIANAIADEIERYYIPRPRFEDGEPVQFGDETDNIESVGIIEFLQDGTFQLCEKSGNGCGTYISIYEAGELVKRPVKKIIGADGIEILENECGYNTDHEEEYTVLSVGSDDPDLALFVRNQDREEFYIDSKTFTHKRPAYDANGKTCFTGETLYDIETGEELIARNLFCNEGVWYVDCGDGVNGGYDSFKTYRKAESLSHVRPDSFEKLRDFASEWSHPDNVSNSSAGDFRDAMQEVTDRLTALIERK